MKVVDEFIDMGDLSGMEVSLKSVEASACQLSAIEREMLAKKLFETVHGKELTEVDEAWLAVAEERSNALMQSSDKGLPEADFFAAIEADLGWR